MSHTILVLQMSHSTCLCVKNVNYVFCIIFRQTTVHAWCFFVILLFVKLDRLTLKLPKKVQRNFRGSFYCILSPTVVFTGRCRICSPVTLQWLGSKTRGTIQNKALSSASKVQLNLKSLSEINSEIAVVKENTLALGCANVFLKANLERTHRRERLSSLFSHSYMYSEYIYTLQSNITWFVIHVAHNDVRN